MVKLVCNGENNKKYDFVYGIFSANWKYESCAARITFVYFYMFTVWRLEESVDTNEEKEKQYPFDSKCAMQPKKNVRNEQ